MKVVLLCGGYGTRLGEETQLKPKPMVEIGGKPILWHIMKIFEKHDIQDFQLALGYKADIIKDYFLKYNSLNNDFSVNLKSGKIEFNDIINENWSINLIDTGLNTMTGGRLLRLKESLKNEETFMLTYGDGVSDIDLTKLLQFHKSHGKIATVTAVRPPVRFGELIINTNNKVEEFAEKPQAGKGWINGGFFVFNKEIFNYLENDSIMLEREPLEKLSQTGELMAYKHHGFWQCMDTIREKEILENLWSSNNAVWLK
jgi:glucose-1-phosphate cytidylyltransferase